MLRSNVCDYSDACVLVKRTITSTGAGNEAEKEMKEIKE